MPQIKDERARWELRMANLERRIAEQRLNWRCLSRRSQRAMPQAGQTIKCASPADRSGVVSPAGRRRPAGGGSSRTRRRGCKSSFVARQLSNG